MRRTAKKLLWELFGIKRGIKPPDIVGSISERAAAPVSAGYSLMAYRQKRIVREQISALAEPKSEREPVVSNDLKSVAQTIEPRIERVSSRTIICSIAIGEAYQKAVAPCIDSQRRYAAQYGLGYCLVDSLPPNFDRPISWLKIPLLFQLLERDVERILYIDADAMITNAKKEVGPKFRALEQANCQFLMTSDESGINAGVMFILNVPATRRMLDLIWLYDADVHHVNWEQNAIKILISAFPEFGKRILLDPRPKAFNSFPARRNLHHVTRLNNAWSAGDFICHFSGMREPELGRCIRYYTK
jgi:hypothetical protein